MVGVAKKLMDKAGKEGKPWISGWFDYKLMTQCTPSEKNFPQLSSALCTRNASNLPGAHQKGREEA